MAWWKLFWNPVEEVAETPEEKFETSAFENVISEPVRSIVKAMISDRKRFIIQIQDDYSMESCSTTKYAVLDIDTEEEFHIGAIYYHGSYIRDRSYYGPAWAASHEVKWANETVTNHYLSLRARAKRINTARERNRLIEIYA